MRKLLRIDSGLLVNGDMPGISTRKREPIEQCRAFHLGSDHRVSGTLAPLEKRGDDGVKRGGRGGGKPDLLSSGSEHLCHGLASTVKKCAGAATVVMNASRIGPAILESLEVGRTSQFGRARVTARIEVEVAAVCAAKGSVGGGGFT